MTFFKKIGAFFLVSGLFFVGGSAENGSKPSFSLKNAGADFPFSFEPYGTLSGRGTASYKFKITDRPGLAKAMGSGLFPNPDTILQEPGYKSWAKTKKTEAQPWDHVNSGNAREDFYIWTRAKEVSPGTKLYFTAQALEQGGLYKQALKAYYGALVLFPGEPCWSADQSFVWYLGPSVISKIESITKHHPEIGYRLQGAFCRIENGGDTNLKNDVVTVDPGTWVKRSEDTTLSPQDRQIVAQRGYGKVQLVQFQNKHWELRVNGKPFVVHGITYTPTSVGHHISEGGVNAWMFQDSDENGKIDGPYDAWVDKNKNNIQDPDEPNVGDFQLMKDMGVNAVRVFRNSDKPEYDSSVFNKELLRDMHRTYGIYAIMGDLLGAYGVGSGASEAGTDYTDPVQLENMRQAIKDYVIDQRDEPYVLMWLLGNENLMSSEYDGVNATKTQASKQVQAYLTFVNEIVEMIHRLDPDHPVAVGNLELTNLEEYAQYAPVVDIYGANAYMGMDGFGDLWKQVREKYDRPVLITEYGCDAFDVKKMKVDEDTQAQYHAGNWNDIRMELADGHEQGNAIGGIIFEYLDEWWKSNQGGWNTQEKTKDSPMTFPDGWSSEEWFGLVSQGDGSKSPFLRQPRKAYTLYRDKLWKN